LEGELSIKPKSFSECSKSNDKRRGLWTRYRPVLRRRWNLFTRQKLDARRYEPLRKLSTPWILFIRELSTVSISTYRLRIRGSRSNQTEVERPEGSIGTSGPRFFAVFWKTWWCRITPVIEWSFLDQLRDWRRETWWNWWLK
jgi:hypothetical protein